MGDELRGATISIVPTPLSVFVAPAVTGKVSVYTSASVRGAVLSTGVVTAAPFLSVRVVGATASNVPPPTGRVRSPNQARSGFPDAQ